MGFFSDVWKGAKDAVSDVWEGTKDAVKDVTGIDSMNDMLFPGLGVSSAMGALQGRGILGETLMGGQPQPPPGLQGPMNQPAPPMSMGTGGGGGSGAGQVQGPDLASLFGDSGYAYGNEGGGEPLSAQLLQANPEAYQFAPLFPSNVG